MIEALDGFGILVFNGSALNCAQLVRTAFECQLGLFYIWESGRTYEQRAVSYQVAHIHSKLKWAQRADAETNVGKELRRSLKDAPHAEVFNVEG